MSFDSLNTKIPGPNGSIPKDMQGKTIDGTVAKNLIKAMRNIGKEETKEKPKEESSLQKFFNSLETNVWLSYHDRGFLKAPKRTQKNFKKNHGFELKPQLWHPLVIGWSEKGRGFGEYTFWEENGKVYCDNECDKRETVKRILCHMVDQAIFVDEEHDKKVKAREEKKKQRKKMTITSGPKMEIVHSIDLEKEIEMFLKS
jgi:hypothetical protein